MKELASAADGAKKLIGQIDALGQELVKLKTVLETLAPILAATHEAELSGQVKLAPAPEGEHKEHVKK